MAKTKRTLVAIDWPTYTRVKEHNEATGIPCARIIDRAINEWLDKNGATQLRALAAKKG